jgi:CheY-like chemotaxis protein
MKKETILVVDDIETNVDILNTILGYDYDIMVALDGKSALQLAQDYHPDLILLDIMMPNMDGYEVCSQLKSNPQTANIPVIFNTARTDEDSIEKAYSVGGG